MTDVLKLPPLPDPACVGRHEDFYSEIQMEEYVLADRAQRQVSDAERLDAAAIRDSALEEAAKMCESQSGLSRVLYSIAKGCAMAIRSQQAQASKEGGEG